MARKKDSDAWEEFRKTQNNDKRYKSLVEGTLAKMNGKHKRKKK
jgi:hypothetical protein